MEKIYIAGAHSRGRTTGHYLTYLDATKEIIAYLYDNDEVNPDYINGVPVIKINKDSELNLDCTVYIGMRGVNFNHITDTLMSCGIKKIVPVDVRLDMELRGSFLKKFYRSMGRTFIKFDELKTNSAIPNIGSFRVFVAISAFDKQIKNEYYMREYESYIQVGCALTDKRLVADYFDDYGENISRLNRQFSELTGLYWIWKHATEDVVGLVHYRRHFILPEDWYNKMVHNGIDVILPTPLYVAPSIEGNYIDRHVPEIWDNMKSFLEKEAIDFFSEVSLYNPCNMFIMKKDILNDLCEWLFSILFSVVKTCGSINDAYQNRYPGFLSERLITYYFEKNRDRYKIVFADKTFLT